MHRARMESLQAFNAGDLGTAITRIQEGIRVSPDDGDLRWLYAQYLCLQRSWAKADAALKHVERHRLALGRSAEVAQELIYGEVKREQVWCEGRSPEFLCESGTEESLTLRAVTYMREGDWRRYRSTLEQRDEKATPLKCLWQGEQYSGWQDLDLPTAPILEVILRDGGYCWVPWREIHKLQFQSFTRPLDALWVPCLLTLRSGREHECFANALYPARGTPALDTLMGRTSQWVDAGDGNLLGSGAKVFLLGEEQELTMHQIGEIEFME